MSDGKRLVQAIFVSPLAALPIRLVEMAITGTLWELSIGPQLLVVLIVGLVAVLIVGLPVHFLLVKMQLRHVAFYVVPGFILPAIYLAFSLDLSVAGGGFAIWLIGLVGVSGACVALAFRYLALGIQSPKHANS